MVSQVCFNEFFKKFHLSRVFQKVSRAFHKCFKGILRKIAGYLKAVFTGFERISKGISVKFERYFKGVSKKFQGYSKKVFMVLVGSFKGVSMEYYVDFKGSKGVQGL